MNADVKDEGCTLVVCEKPDAARRVSAALSEGKAESSVVEGLTVFRFKRGGEDLVVCSAAGHLYSISDPFRERSVYPTFDSEWYSSDLVVRKVGNTARRIAAIGRLAKKSNRFINACDFDAEGETIGFNILRYACGGKEAVSLRVKLSTLTEHEITEAFREAKPEKIAGLALAGRTRHLVDFMWGINLSRVLAHSILAVGAKYRPVSIGRVQGPSLKFLVTKEREVRLFVPTPYWKIEAVFEKSGTRVRAEYSKGRVSTGMEADEIVRGCEGLEGVVSSVSRSATQLPPPPAFNTGDLQKEAYRAFGFSPSFTMQIAEKLYLGARISYPRTWSHKLPVSIDCSRILSSLALLPKFSNDAEDILREARKPVQGTKSDSAHPAIYPTGEKGNRRLSPSESALYDLVVRRFLSAFGQPAVREVVSVGISVGSNLFRLGGARVLRRGWLTYYGKYGPERDVEVPALKTDDKLRVVSVETDEKTETGPRRYSQAGLLEKMEEEGIGTKATRAGIISTLIDREYVEKDTMAVSELGLQLVEAMERHAPSIIDAELTSKAEESLERIEAGEEEAEFLRESVRSIVTQLYELSSNEDSLGDAIGASPSPSTASLGSCPVCKTGILGIVRSRKSGKRFVSCSNYRAGCKASAPLPQRGVVGPTPKPCPHCAWPIVRVLRGRYSWTLCVNQSCPGRREKRP